MRGNLLHKSRSRIAVLHRYHCHFWQIDCLQVQSCHDCWNILMLFSLGNWSVACSIVFEQGPLLGGWRWCLSFKSLRIAWSAHRSDRTVLFPVRKCSGWTCLFSWSFMTRLMCLCRAGLIQQWHRHIWSWPLDLCLQSWICSWFLQLRTFYLRELLLFTTSFLATRILIRLFFFLSYILVNRKCKIQNLFSWLKL